MCTERNWNSEKWVLQIQRGEKSIWFDFWSPDLTFDLIPFHIWFRLSQTDLIWLWLWLLTFDFDLILTLSFDFEPQPFYLTFGFWMWLWLWIGLFTLTLTFEFDFWLWLQSQTIWFQIRRRHLIWFWLWLWPSSEVPIFASSPPDDFSQRIERDVCMATRSIAVVSPAFTHHHRAVNPHAWLSFGTRIEAWFQVKLSLLSTDAIPTCQSEYGVPWV